jgi:hypothetical protein
MPDDFDFRSRFGPVDTDAAKIDTRQVIRRARLRRLPAQIAIGGGVVVAAGVLVVGAAVGLRAFSTSSGSASSSVAAAPEATSPVPAGGSAASDSSGSNSSGSGAITPDSGGAPAEKLNLCGGSLADVAASATGLVLTPHFPDASAGAASVPGSVTLTNTSKTRWSGSTAASPSITLSRHGVVLWHSVTTDTAARNIDLAPGESTTYPAVLEPVVCGVEDDTDGFRTDLPHVAAGTYQVSAAIDAPVDGLADLVTGPSQTISLK